MLGEEKNGRGRVSTPPTSDLILSAIQSVFYLQRSEKTRLEEEESRGYNKKKGVKARSVF